MKKLLCTSIASLALITAAQAFNMPYFTGYTGILGDITPYSESPYITMDSEVFFAGQLDFSGRFLLKGEFYLKTDNLLEDSIFIDSGTNNANFRIEEVSAMYTASSASVTHYFNAFLGNFEPIGSDIFLQRHFGIQPITSYITQSWKGLNGSSIYNFYGAGISYTARLESPIAIGIYSYLNAQEEDDGTTTNVFNMDGRFACVFPNFSLDASGGIGLPIGTTVQTTDDAFLVVSTINIHAGMNMFVGNRYSTCFFMQTGFDDITLSKTEGTEYNTLKFEDWYILLEPRIMFSQFELNISIFNIPADSLSNMIYLKGLYSSSVTNVLGVNAAFVTDKLYLGNTNFTFGIHGTLSVTNPLEGFSGEASAFGEFLLSTYITGFLSTFQEGLFDLNVTPFVTMPVFGGELTTAVSVQIFEFINACASENHDFSSSAIFTLGFKTKI